MKCLELKIPPLPQMITIGHTVWSPGMQHFRRTFEVFDLLIVKKGQLFMTEEGEEFNIKEGGLLTLEPGKTHWGHRPVEEITEIYWLHFIHPHPCRLVSAEQISWSSLLTQGMDRDLAPTQQYMYIPKHTYLELDSIVPLLDEIVELHHSLMLKNALQLHVAAGVLFNRLQSMVSTQLKSQAYLLSEQTIRYLQDHMLQRFQAKHMEDSLHYSFDYLSRCLKQYTGKTPLQYLHHLQLDQAKTLLRQTDLSIQEVADSIGQPNANYFVRLFRQHVGVPPGKFRSLQQELL